MVLIPGTEVKLGHTNTGKLLFKPKDLPESQAPVSSCFLSISAYTCTRGLYMFFCMPVLSLQRPVLLLDSLSHKMISVSTQVCGSQVGSRAGYYFSFSMNLICSSANPMCISSKAYSQYWLFIAPLLLKIKSWLTQVHHYCDLNLCHLTVAPEFSLYT